MSDHRELLIVFARHPEAGAVKTRLAPAIGEEGTAALYSAFIEDLARSFAAAPWEVRWQIAPPDPGFAARFGIAPAACRGQRGRDLGERMREAFRTAREEGCRRTVLIGSDAPQLSRESVALAFEALERADLVLAPALDGGYTLIGMREPSDVFSGIRWSAPTVLQSTLARARALGLRHELLAPIFDVDEPADLERLEQYLSAHPAAELPATRAALERLGRAGSSGKLA